MNSLRDKIWLWGQTPGSHHNVEDSFRLPGVNRMTPEEGLRFFGIPNVCRVKMSVDAGRSFLDDMDLPESAERLCLSLIGAGRLMDNDLEDILTVAKRDGRVCAAIMDDFISEERMKLYPPEALRTFKERLRVGAGRRLDLWSVIYERDLDKPIESRAVEFDLTTFWTWYGDRLAELPENFARMQEMLRGGRMMLGVYMYDYGGRKQLTDDMMRYQLKFAEEKLRTGEIEGVIICSNCIADIGLPTVEVTREWISSLE